VVDTREYLFAMMFKLGRNCPEELDALEERPLWLALGLMLRKGGLTLLLLGAAEVNWFQNEK
jgi:hypothetical protein